MGFNLRLLVCLALAPWITSASLNGQDKTDWALCQDEQTNPTLSMLQLASRAASKESDEGFVVASKSIEGTAREGPAEGTVASPVPATIRYSNAKIYSFQFPVAKYVHELAAVSTCFGPEPFSNSSKNIHLRPGGLAELRIAQFSNAPIGWSGPAGESAAENVPHTLLSVRLPILANDGIAYQTVFAVTEDDVAMKVYRFGIGVPAKWANLTVPSALPGSFSASRRGFTMLEIPSLADAGELSQSEMTNLTSVLETLEINYGTEAAHSTPGGLEADWKNTTTKANIRSARKVAADKFNLFDGRFEGFAWMFELPNEPVEGYVVEADLDVTTTVVALMAEAHSAVPEDSEQAVRNPEDMSGADYEAIDVNPRENKFRYARTFGEFLMTHDNEFVPNAYTRPYMNGDLTWVQMKVNAEKAQKYLPSGATLSPGEPGVFWNTRWQPANPFGTRYVPPLLFYYSEFWVCLPIIYKEQKYTYPVMLLVDEDFLMMAGADHGFPKKLANITYTFSDGKNKGSEVHLDIDRRGRKILSLKGKIGEDTREIIPAVNEDGQDPDAADYIFIISHEFPYNASIDRPRSSMAHEVADTHEQMVLDDIEYTLNASPYEPMLDFFEGNILRGGFMNIDQDFGWSSKTKLSWMMEEPDPKGYAEWWKNNFPVLFM